MGAVSDGRRSRFNSLDSVGAPTTTDREICEYARERASVVFTNDLDFPQILAHTKDCAPSILLLGGHLLTPEARGSAVLSAVDICHADLTNGAIVILDHRDKHRARSLPLR